MAAPPPPPPARGAMSLYADLLDGGGADSEKPAPAVTKAEAVKNPALRFQPIIRRPQQAKAKTKPRASGLPTAIAVTTAATTAPPPQQQQKHQQPLVKAPPVRTSLADWTGGGGDGADGDDDYYDDDDGGGSNSNQKWPQRGGRKRKKKRLEGKQQRMAARDAYVDWNELYDPARPTNLDAYMHSDERIDAARDWKAALYAHRRAKRNERDSHSSDDENDDDDGGDNDSNDYRPALNNAFAPPPPAAFAPPASYSLPSTAAAAQQSGARPSSPPPSLPSPPPPPPPPPQQQQQQQQQQSPPRPDGLIVYKPPIRFAPTEKVHTMDQDNAEEDDDDNAYEPALPEAEAPVVDGRRSNRPGQAGFAARLMAKYGWTQGSGLGADSSGIITPLRHKKIGKTGAGGGPAFGRIVGGGGGRQQADNKSEQVSRVIVLRNMVTGLPDLADEVADGQLVQDIGEECGAQYGRIERVYIDVPGQLVFIQFTEAVSALRAVNALNGRIFNGNAIVPSFYDAAKFDEGIYE